MSHEASNRMPVHIRPLELSDYEGWLPLWRGYNSFYERELPAPITATAWKRFHDPAEPMHALVAHHDGRIVGIVHYLFHRSTSMIEPTCYLQDLFTIASMRGRGVGHALIEAVYAKANEAGAGRVYWQTHETNATAMKLYDTIADRSGFVVYRKLLGKL